MEKHRYVPAEVAAEPESLEQLRGDCARMAAKWSASVRTRGPAAPPVRPEELHGVRVPAGSARLLDGMSEYGD